MRRIESTFWGMIQAIGASVVISSSAMATDANMDRYECKNMVQECIDFADFEMDAIPVVRPTKTNPEQRDLWNQYTGDFTEAGDAGIASISNEEALFGSKSLKVEVTGGNVYLQLYTYLDSILGWDWVKNHLDVPAENWKFDTYNRLRFWVKLPAGISASGGGGKNVSFGTYVRASDGSVSSAESGGHHFYHFLDLESTGEWQQVIIDLHPDHDRGASGSTEHGVQEYPTGESGFNYFDALTRFYFEIDGGIASYPANFYFDGFQFYKDTNDENIDQVYALNGTYIADKNKVVLGWRRRKDQGTLDHEVRYSFEDIHSIGWESAIEAPGGVVTPPNKFDYNGMSYTATGINMESHTHVYFAIKPVGSSKFRQIVLPLKKSTIRPTAPASFSIVNY